MKMESIFFKYFFFSFLFAVFISALIIILILGFFTINFYDKKSIQDIINLEKKYAESELKSANIRVTTLLSKYQANFNELILFYQNIANDLLIDENSHQLETQYLKSAKSVEHSDCWLDFEYAKRIAIWVLDNKSTNNDIGLTSKVAEKQLIALSHLILNLETLLKTSTSKTYSYFFFFEKTGLYFTYPLAESCEVVNMLGLYPYLDENKCVDEDAVGIATYSPKYENYFKNMMKSKTKIFDNNYESNQNRTIFLNNFFFNMILNNNRLFVMCIEFEDPITNGKGYGCVNSTYNDLNEPLDNINKK